MHGVGCDQMADAWYMYIREIHLPGLSGISSAFEHIALTMILSPLEHAETAGNKFVNS